MTFVQGMAQSVYLSAKTTAHIYQIELQERLADMAQRSIELNDLQDQLTVYPMDLKNLFKNQAWFRRSIGLQSPLF